MYVFLGLSVLTYVVIGVEAARPSESSSLITSWVSKAFATLTRTKKVPPIKANHERGLDAYEILYPKEKNPVPIAEKAPFKLSFSYPEGSKEKNWETSIILDVPEQFKSTIGCYYNEAKTTVFLSGLKEAKNVSVRILNSDKEVIDIITVDVGYRTDFTTSSVSLYQDGKTPSESTYKANSYIFIEDNFMGTVNPYLSNSGLTVVSPSDHTNYGWPVYRDEGNNNLGEGTLKKIFPSYQPQYYCDSPYITVDNEKMVALIAEDCPNGEYSIKDVYGNSYPFTVLGKCSSPTSETVMSLLYHEDDGPLQTLDPSQPLQTNTSSIVIKATYSNAPNDFSKLMYCDGLGGNQNVSQNWTYTGPNIRDPLSYYCFTTRGSIDDRNIDIYHPLFQDDLGHKVNLSIGANPITTIKLSSSDGSIIQADSDIPVQKEDVLDYDIIFVRNNGGEVTSRNLVVTSCGEGIEYSFPETGRLHLSFTKEGERSISFSYDEATLTLRFAIGKLTIFNSPRLMYAFSRKILGHAAIYFLLGCFVSAFFFYYLDKQKAANWWPIYSLIVGIPSALLTEIIQVCFPWRAFTFTDTLFNLGGFIVGIGVAAIVAAFIHLYRKNKEKKALPKNPANPT